MPSNLPNSNPVEILDKFETFLFDWDGTVSNTWPQWVTFLVKQFKLTYGLDVTEKQVTATAGDWHSGEQLGLEKGRFDFYEWRRICDRESVKYIKKAELFPGMDELLKRLRASNKKLGVVTSASRTFIDSCIEHHQLEPLFDVVVSADDVTAHKPDPEPIFHALELLDSEPSSTIMLGDMIQDIQAANHAGTSSLFFDPPHHEHHDSDKILAETKPKYVIRSWEELIIYKSNK